VKRFVPVIIWVMAISACAHSAQKETPIDSDFLNVSGNPRSFDGKVVTIRGWLSLEHEDKNIWASKADHEAWATKRCLSIVNYDSLKLHQSMFDGKRVEVTGVVRGDASNGGRLIRLASCRDAGIEIGGPASIKVIE
jgi:hypothetical protein